MAGYVLIGKNRLIPRVTCQGRHRLWSKADQDDVFVNGSRTVAFDEFEALECVVQPMRGKAARDQNNQLGEEGERDYDSYTVYTSTRLLRAREGTDKLSDQLLLKDSYGEDTWFTVMKVDPYPSSGVNRFRCYLIAVPDGTEGGM